MKKIKIVSTGVSAAALAAVLSAAGYTVATALPAHRDRWWDRDYDMNQSIDLEKKDRRRAEHKQRLKEAGQRAARKEK